MKNHILVDKTSSYEKKQLSDPDGYSYDKRKGAWVSRQTKEFLVKSKDPRRPRPSTKKEDVETGEDLKGE